MTRTTSIDTVEPRPQPTLSAVELGRNPDSAYVVLEFSRKTKLLKAFRSETDAKRYLKTIKEDNASFGSPPVVLIRHVDLY